MRRYFTFRLKGSRFEKTIWIEHRNETASSCAAYVIGAASVALGGCASQSLELVSWREGE